MIKNVWYVKIRLYNGEWASAGNFSIERNARNFAKQLESDYNVETKVI